ncbi:MAG: hypothetical protein AABX11_03870 [Nanoarchaeota archaeon]
MEIQTAIIVIITLAIVLLVILYLIERLNKRELLTLDNKKKIIEYYLHKVSELEKIKDLEKKMDKIRTISKKLFNDYYELDLNAPYSEIITFFEKVKMPEQKEFSELMLKYYYKDMDMDEKTMKKMISLLKVSIKNIPLNELDMKKMKINLKMQKKIHKEVIDIINKSKEHVKNKNHKEAERSFSKLEKIQKKYPIKDPRILGKMNNLYDKIIKLYYSNQTKKK